MTKITKRIIMSLFTMMLLFSFTQPKLAFGEGNFNVKPKIVGSDTHSLLLQPNGLVFAWGSNGGSLGDGTTTNRISPVQVKDLTDVVDITAGTSRSFALKSDGTVWGWGYSAAGQLGDGTTTTRLLPVKLPNLTEIIKIAGGSGHALALKSDGTVWAWGTNSSGQVGDGTNSNRSTAVQVQRLTDVVDIAGGSHHSLALKSDGTVWAWGSNSSRTLGDGTSTNSSVPVQVKNLTDVVAIDAGQSHSLAVKSDGTVWAWGENTIRQLGTGNSTNSSIPVQVKNLSKIVKVSSDFNHSLALASDGTVWGWGSNSLGESTGESIPSIYEPFQVKGLNDVIEIGAGRNYSLAIKSDGTVWVWGKNDVGQLGDGTTTNSIQLLQIPNVILDIPEESKNPDLEVPETENPQPSDPVDGQSDDVDFVLNSGILELQTAPIQSFGEIQIDNQIKPYKTSFESAFNIKDLRGTQAGWRLDVSATQFKVVEPIGGFKAGTSANKLPIGSLTLSPLESINRIGIGDGGLPVNKLSGNTIIDDGIVTVATANMGDGVGEFDLVFPEGALTLVINPATAKVDTVNYPNGTPYESTLTWTLVSAP